MDANRQKKEVFIVEDEEDVVELIRYNLERNGFSTRSATDAEKAIAELSQGYPDLFILDIMLPGMDGLELCRQLKSRPDTAHIPIIMVTARDDETDMVVGLELGADDYITKPFSPRVLVARVKAVIRRQVSSSYSPKAAPSDTLHLHGITLDIGRHLVTVSHRSIHLSSSEFKLLKLLMQKPGWVFTRDQIVNALHGPAYPVTDRSVDVQILNLRKKLGEQGKVIETVRGVGYRMKETQ